MKTVFLLILLAIPCCFTRELISSDEIGLLFGKYLKGTLTNDEEQKINLMFELFNGHVDFTSLDNYSDNRMVVTCMICRNILQTFFDLVKEGQPDETLINTIDSLCTGLNIVSPAVCRGAIELNLPIIKYIILNTPEATPNSYCGLLLQSGTNPNACPITDPRFEWQVTIPAHSPVNVNNVVVPSNTDNLKVVLITDAHLDPLYEAYGVGNCDEPTCCRVGQKEALVYEYKSNIDDKVIDDTFINVDGKIMLNLTYADDIRQLKQTSRTRFLRNSEPAGYWGDYRNCDSPIWAYDDVIERIASEHKDVDMVYYMGDTIDHGVWETTYELINDMNAHVIDKLNKEFGPNVPVIPVIGNHESQPTNQFAPPRVTEAGLDTHWLYEALVEKWGPYLDEEAKINLRERGDFSLVIRPGLRVISLNNNVAYTFNWWIVFDPQDAKWHLDWLIEELLKAEEAGEKVHILTHIPPGGASLTKSWTREYNRIINRFSSIITAEFNGHTHADEYRIFYSLTDGSPINMAWAIGGTTAHTFNNLNYKIATFDSTNFELLNFENYIYNLTEANLTPYRRPHWFQLYDFKERFQLDDLSPQSMHDLTYRMASTHKHLLDLYSAFQSRVSDMRWPYCGDSCKAGNLCRAVITDLWERERCDELTNMFYSNSLIIGQ